MVMIGILPTLTPELHDARVDQLDNPRYALLDEQMLLARGEDLHIDIRRRPGVASRPTPTPSRPRPRAPVVQFHLQVSPDEFAQNWNAAQCLAAAQVALGANSPYFLGRELWRETRIALFTQATDTRPGRAQGAGRAPARLVRRALDHQRVRPVRGEHQLLPGAAAGDRRRGPGGGARGRAARRRCTSCGCTTARSGAGTARCTTSSHGTPAPARREPRAARRARRSSTSSPTARSTSARCARSPSRSGRCGRRCSSAPPRRTSSPLRRAASRPSLFWPGIGEVPVTELVAAPAAPAGPRRACDEWGVDDEHPRAPARRHRGPLHHAAATAPPGRSTPSTRSRRRLPLARGGAAPHDAGVRRAHAHQRAGAHLVRRLTFYE